MPFFAATIFRLWGADVKTFSEIRDRILTTDDPQ